MLTHMGCAFSTRTLSTLARSRMATPPSRVVIVGGGIVGASTAYYLSLKGVQATVIEQAGVASHSSGKAAGFLASDWNDAAVGELSRKSYVLHKELAEKFGAENIGYRPMTCLGVGHGGMHQASGRSWLDKISNENPMGTEATVAQVHPRKLTNALLEASGAEVIIARVVGVEVKDGAVVGIKTQAGEVVPCEAAVFAMGAWAQQCSAWFPELAPLLKDTVGKKYTSVIFDTVCDNTAVFLESEHQVEIYPRVDEVYANGCPLYEALPDNPLDIEPDLELAERVRSEVALTSSKLASAKVKVTTACFLPSSADGFPAIGQVPGTANAWIACGHTCWGILNAPATGKALAQLIVQDAAEEERINLEAFDPGREPEKCCMQ